VPFWQNISHLGFEYSVTQLVFDGGKLMFNPLQKHRVFIIVAQLVLLTALFSTVALAVETPPVSTGDTEVREATPKPSHRLIIELDTPPLAEVFQQQQIVAASNSSLQNLQLNADSASAQNYIAQLQMEQQAFVNSISSVIPDATVSTFINELGAREQATYQVVFNGISIDPGSMDRDTARERLSRMAGVKAVYYDLPYVTQLYTSTALINAPQVWNSPEIGGIENAGAGIKFASMDGGVHKDAPMMDGTGYEYPEGFEPNGIGLTANNNGKIIASRVYFRDWDPPSIGDENPWPGVSGTSHGIHTASTAAGGLVDDVEYLGLNVGSMSGVAPKAYVMSYRVFYASVGGNESFYTTEGIAALEDIVKDGADVVQNSWGEGPISEGGQFDPLDTALSNAVKAGVFVSMSAGNSGPGYGTGDHASPDYINVAATTTSGTLAAGQLNIVDNNTLQEIAFGTADFGPALDLGMVFNFPFVTAGSVDPANVEGCAPFPEGAFDGVAAAISRGACNFSDKAYHAELAGATFVVIYNNRDGDAILNMSCGSHCEPGEINISSILISENDGLGLLDHFDESGADGSAIEVSTLAFQAGNDPDIVTGFSSRGPAVGNLLKPDIAAPGVNILAQGYGQGVIGEDRHLGYGQASGTSMAGPHVAGAAVLLKQLYPQWSPDAIKSALMSTAQYMEIYNPDGSPAQPLDMGAGRLDVAAAMDPGVILDPPSLSFGLVPTGTEKTITVSVINITDSAETYTLSTLYTGDSFTQTTELPGFSISPESVTLEPGATAQIQVSIDTTASSGLGDNQGYIVMSGDQGHNAHMAAWARVSYAQSLAQVLVLDNDGSASIGNFDYSWYYTSALDELGYSYEVIDVDANFGSATTIPDATRLAAYDAIVHFTGDNYQPDGSFAVSTGLTALDKDRLVAYLNDGGSIIAMGQDLAGVLDANVSDAGVADRDFYYVYRLGANFLQDSITNNAAPTQLIVPAIEAPAALSNVLIDLTRANKLQAGGQLLSENEVPAVDAISSGSFTLNYDIPQNTLEFAVTVAPSMTMTSTTPITITGMHIHAGAADENGDVVRSLDLDNQLPLFITDTVTFSGVVSPSLTADEYALMADGGLYINVHTTDNPSGELRGQIQPEAVDNQFYVDELDNEFHDGSQDPNGDGTTSESNLGSTPLLRYVSPQNLQAGTVAMAHRDQPSLERPGTDYSGQSIYAAFGLEGMSEQLNATTGYTPTSRSELLDAFLTWTWSEPAAVEVLEVTPVNASALRMFTATLTEGTLVQIRWDFGDGSDYIISGTDTVGHRFEKCGAHTVRAEIEDTLGNVSVGSLNIDVDKDCMLPLVVTMSAVDSVVAEPGKLISVTLNYENSSEQPLSTSIEMVVPAGTTFGGSTEAGWSCAVGSVAGTVCQLAIEDLAAAASGSAVFEVMMSNDLTATGASIEFAAAAPSDTDETVILGIGNESITVAVTAPTALKTIPEPGSTDAQSQQIFLPFLHR